MEPHVGLHAGRGACLTVPPPQQNRRAAEPSFLPRRPHPIARKGGSRACVSRRRGAYSATRSWEPAGAGRRRDSSELSARGLTSKDRKGPKGRSSRLQQPPRAAAETGAVTRGTRRGTPTAALLFLLLQSGRAERKPRLRGRLPAACAFLPSASYTCAPAQTESADERAVSSPGFSGLQTLGHSTSLTACVPSSRPAPWPPEPC